MSDEVDVDVGDGIPIEIEVGVGSALSVDASAQSAASVAAVEATAVSAHLASPQAVSVQPGSAASLSVQSGEQDPVDVLVGALMSLTQEQLDRLVSQLMSADRVPQDDKLADATSYGGFDDSLVWESTDVLQETICWPIWANELRDSGVMIVEATGEFENTGAGSFYVEFALDVAEAPQTTDFTDLLTFGVLNAFSNVWSKDDTEISVGLGGSGRWHAHIEVHSEGHQGTTWTQTVHVEFTREARPATSPKLDPKINAVYPISFDPTLDNEMRLRFRTTTALGAGQSFTVLSARARVASKRDGQ